MVSPVLRQQASWRRSLKVIAVIAMLSLAGTPVSAADKPLVRFLAPVNEDGSINYSTRGSVDLFLPFIGTPMPPNDPNRMELYVTPFAGGQGDNISVTPYIAELSDVKPENQRLLFLLDRPIMTLRLKVPELPTASKYVGHIVITKKDKEPQINRIVLTQPTAQPPAQLSVDTRSNTVYHTQSLVKKWIWPTNPSSFTMFVLNADPEWQARGVFLRLLEVTTPEGANFDPQWNLTLTWNGQKAGDLWRVPSAQDANAVPHVIPPSNQAEIGGEFHNLAPGKYILKLGLAAANVAPQAESQMTVTVWVRHSVVGAIVVLLLAIAISFIATKGLEGLRRRTAVLKKTSDLKLPFLREDTAPNVSIRATLKQVEDRNRSWYAALSGPEVVNDRVDKAARMIGILRRIHQIRERISNWDAHIMIKYRVEKRLSDITADIAPETVNEESAEEIKRKLDEINEWITSDKPKLCDIYWADVESRIENLLCQAKPDAFPEQKHEELVTYLVAQINEKRSKIRQSRDALNLKKAAEIDENYARLKVLWECKQNGDDDALRRLVSLFDTNKSPDITGFFKERDTLAWERLKNASDAKPGEWLKFTSPQERTVDPFRAYELIEFKVESIPKDLGNNYLFRNGLDYHWSLYLETETRPWWRPWRKTTQTKKLAAPRTKEPRLVQYVPRKGRLSASVNLCYNNDCTAAVRMENGLTIDKSKDFGWIRSFRFVEFTAIAIAALFAIISGLQMYYIGKPGFGSLENYFNLFIWGAAVDQGKNFVQILAQSHTAKGTPS